MSASMFRRVSGLMAGLATIFATALLSAAPVLAQPTDSDGDGMPDRWEQAHGLRAHRADARLDLDHDGLSNLGEYRHHALPEIEDSDHDGHDDGDEVSDDRHSTDVDDADTDDDGTPDGDEDADHDGTDNEDEDDADETCAFDDLDRDDDNVADEDENEQGTRVRNADSDDDGAGDGDEDEDGDGQANEDEDDSDTDDCDGDSDEDGEDDEDGDDLLGVITGFDRDTLQLTVTAEAGGALVLQLTADTEVESGDEDGSFADLRAGVQVAEVDIDDDNGTVEEIELFSAGDED